MTPAYRLQLRITKLFYFAHYFLRHFNMLLGMQTASSLAYATLLSIVPLITVMFGLFGEISILKEVSESIQDFIFSSFVPELGSAVQSYIGGFSAKASQLTISGSMILVFIAIMLMATIDNAFNRIWFVRNKRNPIARLLVYWAVLTMGPLLIGLGLASTSYLLSLPVVADVDSSFNLRARLLSWLPFTTTSVAFTLLYILVPNCHVQKKHALTGGIICAGLFEFAKYGFGIYVRAMPSYQNIYGAISVIPLFLIWIYVSWVIVLFGAHITFCLSSFRLDNEVEHRNKSDWTFLDALRVVEHLYQAQREGKTVSIADLRKRTVNLQHYKLNNLLDHLQRYRWVNETNSEWLLSKDLRETTLFELHKVLPARLPISGYDVDEDPIADALKSQLSEQQNKLRDTLSIPVSDFIKQCQS